MWRQVASVLHLSSEVEQVNSFGVTWLCEEALHLCWEWRQTLEEQPCSPRKFLTFFDAVLVTRNPWHASFTCKSAIGKMFFHDTHSELDYLSITDLMYIVQRRKPGLLFHGATEVSYLKVRKRASTMILTHLWLIIGWLLALRIGIRAKCKVILIIYLLKLHFPLHCQS